MESAVETARRRPGRPARPPVATEPISDVEAFGRLKESPRRLDSYQAIRTVAFCLEFQQAGGSIAGLAASGRYGRRTAFNRQSSCRAAGFEPGLVRFVVHTEDFWAEEDRAQAALIETWPGAGTVRAMQPGAGQALGQSWSCARVAI